MNIQYELGIIGAGPAGYHAALKAAEEGMSVVLFERGEPGGICLFEGCIPTKSLVTASKDYFRLSKSTVVKSEKTVYDWEAARQKKEKDVKKLAAGLNMQLRNAKIPVIKASAKLKEADETGVVIDADGELYYVRDVMIATGSCNVVPPIEGIKEALDVQAALDSTAVLRDCPPITQFLVIGAGVIGLELASIYANTGSEVTVLEREETFLTGLDETVKAEYIQTLKRKGIHILPAQQVECVKMMQTAAGQNQVIVKAVDRKSGAEKEYTAERILVAAGRTGCTENIGLEHVPQVKVRNGFIETDERHMTGCAHVYACGDVCGKELLAYTAGLAGEQLVKQLRHGFDTAGRQDFVPQVVFTNPEAAYIGVTEDFCMENGISYRQACCSMNYSSLFAVENERENGAFKLICDNEMRILGCHIIGNGAAGIIGTIQAYMTAGLTLPEIISLPIIHPSHLEIIKECIKMIDGGNK